MKDLLLGSVIAAVALIIWGGVWLTGRGSEESGPPQAQRQLTFSGSVIGSSMSPDGRFVAYIEQRGDSQALRIVEP